VHDLYSPLYRSSFISGDEYYDIRWFSVWSWILVKYNYVYSNRTNITRSIVEVEVQMMGVRRYEDIEQLWADLEEQRKLAIEAFNNCTEKQKTLKEGDIFVTSAYDLTILNQIQTLDPEDEREFEYAKSMGYVMVKAWSNACPDGEMGSVHRSHARYKLVDSDEIKAEFILNTFLDVWAGGGEIDKYDLQWIRDSNNLEVLFYDPQYD
jgi:hypothetical protein